MRICTGILFQEQEFLKKKDMSYSFRQTKLWLLQIRIAFSGNAEDQAAIVDMMHEAGVRMIAMNEKGMDIEKLYMELTKGGEADVR